MPSVHPVVVEVLFLRHEPDLPSAPGDFGELGYRVVRMPLPLGCTPDQAAAEACGGGVEVLHSTSWRYDPADGVQLTYVALPDPQPGLPATTLAAPSVVCSGDPLRPSPDLMHIHHVAAHAVRHLAYLADRDPGIMGAAAASGSVALWSALAQAAATMPTGTHSAAHQAAEHPTTGRGGTEVAPTEGPIGLLPVNLPWP